jgi:hypothetical protein
MVIGDAPISGSSSEPLIKSVQIISNGSNCELFLISDNNINNGSS